jgi:hypothetical protein
MIWLAIIAGVASAASLPPETKAMCAALRDSEPLAATPIADTVAQFRGKHVLRDKYDDDAAYAAKVAALAQRFPELSTPLAVSFRLDEDRIEYHPASQSMTFPLGPVGGLCALKMFGENTSAVTALKHSDASFSVPLCATEAVSTSAGKPYQGTNAYGAKAMVDVLETVVAGIYVGTGETMLSPLFKSKTPSGFERSFGFKIAPNEARKVSREAELVVVVVPRAPFFLEGFDVTGATIAMPREERITASYVAGEVVCSAIRLRATKRTLVYRAATGQAVERGTDVLSSFASPRGDVAVWLTSMDGPFDQIGLNLMVGPDGRVSNCWGDGKNIGQENKACALVTKRARFSPAIDLAGQPVKQLFRFEVGPTK